MKTKHYHLDKYFWLIFVLWLYLLLTGASSCASMKAYSGPVKLTVSIVRLHDDKTEVWANRGYMVYFGRFAPGGPADTLKRGSVIIADPYGANPKKDTCQWGFRRIK